MSMLDLPFLRNLRRSINAAVCYYLLYLVAKFDVACDCLGCAAPCASGMRIDFSRKHLHQAWSLTLGAVYIESFPDVHHHTASALNGRVLRASLGTICPLSDNCTALY